MVVEFSILVILVDFPYDFVVIAFYFVVVDFDFIVVDFDLVVVDLAAFLVFG